MRFILNVVQDDNKRPVAILAGEPEATFVELVRAARELYEVPIPHQFDVAVAGVGYPKDENLYQASRAASYLFFAPTSVVKEGGVFIVPAPTGEGAGAGVGEQRFLETMRQATDMPTLLDDLRRTGYPPGAQRAFVMAKVLEKNLGDRRRFPDAGPGEPGQDDPRGGYERSFSHRDPPHGPR